jgi:uncharacterized protein (TIGR02266 family)
MFRLTLTLPERSDWVKVFDPRGSSVFVATPSPPPLGEEVRVELHIIEGGPRVILKGKVTAHRPVSDGQGEGAQIALMPSEREKVNFINGYVRGGLLNRRERRRLPLRLPVTFGGLQGAVQTYTRDINEEGLFIVAEKPLPERTVVHFVLGLPGREPQTLKGTVTHTVLVEDEDVPGMGIRFSLDEAQTAIMATIADELEAAFFSGTLPEEIIT